MASPSTIARESASPARAFTNEHVHTEATLTYVLDDHVPATQVAREGHALPQQPPMGNPLAFMYFS